MNTGRSKSRNFESSFKLIELLLWVAIATLFAFPILRVVFGEEIKDFERQVFEFLGVSPFLQVVIGFVLGCLALYLRLRPEIQKAKGDNKPLIGRPVKIFALCSFIMVIILIYIGL